MKLMKLWNALRTQRRRPHVHLIAHIADTPTIIHEDDIPYLVFHVSEAPGIEFRMRVFPTSRRRRQGERVEISYVHVDGHVAVVERLFAAPDEEVIRQRHKDYLTRVRKQVERSSARPEA